MRGAWAASAALVVLLAPLAGARAQAFDFRPPPASADAALAVAMRDLAARVLPVYQENHPERYLSYLSALQVVAGNDAAADASRRTLSERRRANGAAGTRIGEAVVYDVYVHARAIEAPDHLAFVPAFEKSYRDIVGHLGDLDAYAVTSWHGRSIAVLEDSLRDLLHRQQGRTSIGLADAVNLVWTYFAFDAARAFDPLVDRLAAEDEQRRYGQGEDARIRTPDGASIAAAIVRPRGGAAPTSAERMPTLLIFTIDARARAAAREIAAHGYAGVVALARGADERAGHAMPWQRDGSDAHAVIDWIAHQPWSDGRVAMIGDGYAGFAAWAAARRAPPALKAIATTNAMAPGIDFPMQGNIFHVDAYRWAIQAGTAATPPGAPAELDDTAWNSLQRDWYASGRPVRDLDDMLGRPSRAFHRWLNHPSYDLFWQDMVPAGADFAAIGMPVLTLAGFYADGAVGALHYFTQHQRFNPRADDTLLAGPFDDAAATRDAAPDLRGLPIEASAQVDLDALRYAWLDHVLKGAAKPPLLADRVNVAVPGGEPGSGAWRHVPSIAALGDASLRLFLDPAPVLNGHALKSAPPSGVAGKEPAYVALRVDLADRHDVNWTPPLRLVRKEIQARHGVSYFSDPLPQPLEVGGFIAGRLDVMVNKMDMDLRATLYELLPGGDYVQVFDPPCEFRASYASDRAHRRLLHAGERQQLAFRCERLASRRFRAGSRIVFVIGVNKRPDQEIDYGTGKDVREESVDDADDPLKIRWYATSYVDIPMRK